ncbi:MAG: hypothetical protein ACQSGP_22825 [Frankia sp.]
MYGFEFQTKNVFVKGDFPKGVGEREVAWRHDSGTTTLEGDETFIPGATAALEFVTVPFDNKEAARESVGHASHLAGKLAAMAKFHGASLVFKAGNPYEGGQWLRDCELRITDQSFRAAAQGTVGVPLAQFGHLVETAIARMPEMEPARTELDNQWQEILGSWTRQIPWLTPQVSPELRGFMSACQLFLVRCTGSPQSIFVTTDVPAPATSPKIFDFSDSEFTRHGYRGKVAPAKYLVKVGTDSPKSLFPILHRTDFHSMFRSLPADDQKFLKSIGAGRAIWPYGPPEDSYIFPLPYRADPEATDTAARTDPLRLTRRTESPLSVESDRSQAVWPLVTHGPSIAEWWHSVLCGDHRRDGIPKDAASPPPGHRGRKREFLDNFPNSKTENKAEYYGMGAFPMDGRTGNQLAVFEYRGLIRDKDLDEDTLTWDRWGKIVDVFVDNYVPRR